MGQWKKWIGDSFHRGTLPRLRTRSALPDGVRFYGHRSPDERTCAACCATSGTSDRVSLSRGGSRIRRGDFVRDRLIAMHERLTGKPTLPVQTKPAILLQAQAQTQPQNR
jgi:hypothetical protein